MGGEIALFASLISQRVRSVVDGSKNFGVSFTMCWIIVAAAAFVQQYASQGRAEVACDRERQELERLVAENARLEREQAAVEAALGVTVVEFLGGACGEMLKTCSEGLEPCPSPSPSRLGSGSSFGVAYL